MSDTPSPLLSVMLACNDRHGSPDPENLTDITIGSSDMILLEGPPLMWRWCSPAERAGPCPGDTEADAPYLLKLYGLTRFPVWRHRRCVGNLYWDEVLMSLPTVQRLLVRLWMGGWSLTEGPVSLFDRWRDHKRMLEVSAEELADYVQRNPC